MSARNSLLAVLLCGVAVIPARHLTAQTPSSGYDDRWNELTKLKPTDQVAAVKGLTLTRDAAQLVMDSGSVVQLSPVGGRTVAVVFTGKGSFRFTPPNGIERERLKQF